MNIAIILILLLIAMILFFLELFIVPGTIISGFFSILLFTLAIVISYIKYDPITGHVVLISSIVLFVIFITFAFQRKTWKRVSLSAIIDSTSPNRIIKNEVPIGSIARTTTRLGPYGEIELEGKRYEAICENSIVEAGQEVEVIRFFENKIYVKPKLKK